MLETILFPLDGSESAEVAVPYVEFLARGFGSEVVLLNVFSPEREPYRRMHRVYLERMGEAMLRRVGKGIPGGVAPRVRLDILPGDPAGVICDYVQKNGVAAVVMAASGGSGITKWAVGNVADKVLRIVNVPTVLVRPGNVRIPPARKSLIRRILLPLDGSVVSRASVPYALELATRFKAGITLFGMAEDACYYTTQVSFVPYSDRMAAEVGRMNAAAEKNVRDYLDEVAKELREKGVRVTTAVAMGTNPAHEILSHEDSTGADFVVMATRGSGRLAGNRWAFGSVTEKVLRGGNLPLLLVR